MVGTTAGRARRAAPLGALAVAGLLSAATARLFLCPPLPAPPPRADAVVVLSGDVGDRLPRAQRLMRDGVAPVLVVSNGRREQGGFCDSSPGYQVLCPTPHPLSTGGEAVGLGRLASERGWRRLAVVTTRYHVTRAGLMMRRCTTAKVTMVASSLNAGAAVLARQIVREWGGLVRALTIRRGC